MIKQINDRFGLGEAIQAITPAEEMIAKKNHIPTFKGKLFERDDFGNLIFKRSNTGCPWRFDHSS